MEPGRLRHRLTFKLYSDSVNSDGTVKRAAGETTVSKWGYLEPMSSRELLEAQRQNFDGTHTVTVRALDEFTVGSWDDSTNMTVTKGSKVYEVIGLMEYDRLQDEMTTLIVKRRET